MPPVLKEVSTLSNENTKQMKHPGKVAEVLSRNWDIDTLKKEIVAREYAAKMQLIVGASEEVLQKQFPKIAVNMQPVAERLKVMTASVLQSPLVPDIVKKRFLEDIMKRTELLSRITPSSLTFLQVQRATNSAGIELIQTLSMTPEQTTQYYLQIATEETLTQYASGAIAGIQSTYMDTKTQENGAWLHTKSLNTFTDEYTRLDAGYGVNVSRMIREIKQKRDFTNVGSEMIFWEVRSGLFEEFAKLDPEFARNTLQIRATLRQNPNFQIQSLRSIPAVKTKIGEIPFLTLLESYRVPLVKFQDTQLEITRFKDRAEWTDIVSWVREKMGMDNLNTDLSHINVSDIQTRLTNMSAADCVILLVKITHLVPGIGDILSTADSLVSGANGISTEGRVLWNLERSMGLILWALGIFGIGALALRGKNMQKIAAIIDSLAVMRKVLPMKLSVALSKAVEMENGGIEMVAGTIKLLRKTLPQSLLSTAALNKIEQDVLAIKKIHWVSFVAHGESATGKYVDIFAPTNVAKSILKGKTILSQWLHNQNIEERVADKALLQELKSGQKYTFSTPEWKIFNGRLLEKRDDGAVHMKYKDRLGKERAVWVAVENLYSGGKVRDLLPDSSDQKVYQVNPSLA